MTMLTLNIISMSGAHYGTTTQDWVASASVMNYESHSWSIVKGLMSGVKMTSHIGSIANLLYLTTLTDVLSIPLSLDTRVGGDDAALMVHT